MSIDLTGSNLTIVIVVAVIALLALVVAAVLVREVLAASEGTARMKEIAAAVQEGASAYLNRQFKTLAIFAVIVFFVLFLLPADTTSEKIGRSIFFIVGAVFFLVPMLVSLLGLVEGIIYLTKSDADFQREYITGKKAWL